MSSLRRLGIHKVCLRRRALTSHLLRHFWCFAVLKLRFFVPARTKPESIPSYSQDFGRSRGEKDRFKTVCFLVSTGHRRAFVSIQKISELFASAGVAELAQRLGLNLADALPLGFHGDAVDD